MRNVIKIRPTPAHVPSESNEDATIVTAYFDIGTFPKGGYHIKFSNNTYLNWAARFKYIMNPVIFYTDSKPFADIFSSMRIGLENITKIFIINRNSTWAFQRRDKIAAIFKTPGYPKHLPNTVVPEYACAQFAKYDVISRAAKENIFQTKYYMWLDIGYFRDRLTTDKCILEKPKDFNDSRIAMNLVYFNRNMSASPQNIFKQNIVWVGGGLVFGERNLVIQYDKQFMKAVDYFISIGLMNTDQQVTYGMFSDTGRKALNPEIELHVHKPEHEYNWFDLGFKMLRTIK